MKENNLVSNYTLRKYKVHKNNVNNSKIENIIDRNFNNKEILEAVVSDLTYVRIGNIWGYICLVIDLFNSEIIGYSLVYNKNAELVKKAILSSKYTLKYMQLFHSDRGNEYDNSCIDEIFEAFNIKRSLSRKRKPI